MNKMLPQKHFDLIEKEAMDMLKSSTDASNINKSKKVVDIKENSITKNDKPLSDDEYDDDYDYNYDIDDDGDNDSEEVVSITPKPVPTTKGMYIRAFKQNKKAKSIKNVSIVNSVGCFFVCFTSSP